MKTLLTLACAVVVSACASSQVAHTAAATTATIVPASAVTWEQLNPARGDKSPRAATLWGDRNGTVATGFLVRFVDGFSSPPHIHNVSYRGVVIRGLVHNGDPKADAVWMPVGSYWTQPKGGVHITAANGGETVAYIEIEEGPYLVRPADQAFDAGEEPVNVDASRVAWAETNGVRRAPLWGDPADDAPSGALLQLPAGASAKLQGHGATLRAVVIQGRIDHRGPGQAHAKTLEPGSYFGAEGASTHQVACLEGSSCVLYVRVEGRLDVVVEARE
ncbi:MAG: DUF4437 domain-containing protein [Deltaproteobacteria bacterium]|nr:MAG: DUF4437 domain-containing protein [Deltaproteobacteria bacterium]